jgi:subtilisin family serine protease
MKFLILTAALILAAGAEAQIRLPTQLPSLPLPALQQNLGAPEPLDAATVRRQLTARLIRSNRRLIEADPDGEPIVRGKVLAVGIDEEILSHLAVRGFTLERTESIAASNLNVIVLKVPESLSTRQALKFLRAADAQGVYDYDHIYLGSGLTNPNPLKSAHATAGREPVRARIRVGLVDTGVDETHPAFRDSDVHSWGCGGKRVPDAHGTAVASLLVAHAEAELYAADVYCAEPTGGSVDIIIAALGWMADQQVGVINVSLVGPKNLLLERIVGALIARGHIIVAAVGNDGPSAPPLYPAAYPEVVGVTGVDARRHVLIEAERGPQVMFAALGADLTAAGLDRGYAAVRGTSFAAPTVAALLASMAPLPDKRVSLEAINALAKKAIDLGPAGRDLTYGFGLVGADIF